MDKKDINKLSEEEATLLLNRFNNRDEIALGEVYDIYYRELHYFVNQLYRDSHIQADDVIHDIFIKVWETKNLNFKKLDNIKAYLYVSIRNGFSDWISHNQCVARYNDTIIRNDTHFVAEMVESEAMSALSMAMQILPKDIAAVFQLVVEGWEMKEISTKLNISKSSAYAKKTEAVTILKNKLPKNVYSILLTISNL